MTPTPTEQDILLEIIQRHRSYETRIKRRDLLTHFVNDLQSRGMMNGDDYMDYLSSPAARQRWDRHMRKELEKLRGTQAGCLILSTSGGGGGYWLGSKGEVDLATAETMAKGAKMIENAKMQRRLAKLPDPAPVQIELFEKAEVT